MLDFDLAMTRIDCVSCGWSGHESELVVVAHDQLDCPRCSDYFSSNEVAK